MSNIVLLTKFYLKEINFLILFNLNLKFLTINIIVNFTLNTAILSNNFVFVIECDLVFIRTLYILKGMVAIHNIMCITT